MSCSVYRVDLVARLRYPVASLLSHTDMSQWLRDNGERDVLYELWKSRGIHSRWCWKTKKDKWGRMATPRKKVRED